MDEHQLFLSGRELPRAAPLTLKQQQLRQPLPEPVALGCLCQEFRRRSATELAKKTTSKEETKALFLIEIVVQCEDEKHDPGTGQDHKGPSPLRQNLPGVDQDPEESNTEERHPEEEENPIALVREKGR